jgi:hypothetical protein
MGKFDLRQRRSLRALIRGSEAKPFDVTRGISRRPPGRGCDSRGRRAALPYATVGVGASLPSRRRNRARSAPRPGAPQPELDLTWPSRTRVAGSEVVAVAGPPFAIRSICLGSLRPGFQLRRRITRAPFLRSFAGCRITCAPSLSPLTISASEALRCPASTGRT